MLAACGEPDGDARQRKLPQGDAFDRRARVAAPGEHPSVAQQHDGDALAHRHVGHGSGRDDVRRPQLHHRRTVAEPAFAPDPELAGSGDGG